MKSGLRVWLLGLLAVAVWAIAGPLSPDLGWSRAASGNAPPTEFSAARAGAVLTRLLGPQTPHPLGDDAGMHERLLAELARLNVPAQTITGMSCRAERSAIVCGTVSDVIASALPGTGKQVLLMAHLDSVAAGPGASDDASGVATLLETIRALRAGSAGGHPVAALFSDGEEAGLLGAALYLNDPGRRARIGAVINVEARGTKGPSYLFQTSPGDGPLVDLYARSVSHPAASSLYAEIYRRLPNDTDLTLFLRAGLPGYNFAFIGNGPAYHTPLDRFAALEPATLQSQGDNVLGLARGLRAADFAALRGGNAIYLDVLRLWLARLPQIFALPLGIAALVLILLAAWRGRRPTRIRGQARNVIGFITPPLFVLGAAAAGYGLSALAGWISGNADPAFAHPLALRLALAFGVWAAALLAMRSAGAVWCWLWLTGLGILAAIFAPGLSPYFLFPAALTAVLLWLHRGVALWLGALAAMLIWIGFAAQAEAIMGLAAHPLFTIPVALGLVPLLPLLGGEMGARARRISILVSLGIALGAAVAAGLQPAYSAAAPERLNLRYVEKDGKSWLLADPVARLPESLRRAARFSEAPGPLATWRGYVAPLGIVQFSAPSATVTRSGGRLTLELHGAKDAGGMALMGVDNLSRVTVGDAAVEAPHGPVTIACATPDCASARMVLDFAGPPPSSLLLVEQRHGLPPNAVALARLRPDWAVPSGQGDMTLIATDVAVPEN